MKNIYFLSDAHLGSLAIPHRRMQERRLVRFLDSIKEKAAAVYLLGDMFDFWYEYKYVVPKGFTRFLGKISELTDMGVEVHYFTGNHDIWAYDYLERECGVILHKQPLTVELYGKVFYLAHGDGLGDQGKGFKVIRSIFHNRLCQWAFSALHPRWGIWFGQTWAKHSRLKRPGGEEQPYMGEEREPLLRFTRHYIQYHPNVDYFIYGHRHIEIDKQLTKKARVVVLGDWISQFSYVVYDGEHLFMSQYIEGESKV